MIDPPPELRVVRAHSRGAPEVAEATVVEVVAVAVGTVEVTEAAVRVLAGRLHPHRGLEELEVEVTGAVGVGPVEPEVEDVVGAVLLGDGVHVGEVVLGVGDAVRLELPAVDGVGVLVGAARHQGGQVALLARVARGRGEVVTAEQVLAERGGDQAGTVLHDDRSGGAAGRAPPEDRAPVLGVAIGVDDVGVVDLERAGG